MPSQPLDLEALLRIPLIDSEHGFDISPDGQVVVFAWNPTGQWEIYQVGLDGAAPPQQLTSGAGHKFAPKFAPDGRRLLYLLDLDGGEAFDICLLDLPGGASRNLTPDTPWSIQPEASWSPDGEWIAFQADLSGVFDTYIMPVDGGAARCVFQCGAPNENVRWSPDGKHLGVCALSGGQDYTVYVVPLDGGPAWALALDGRPLNARQPCWSPDGARLAVAAERGDRFAIALSTLADGKVAWWEDPAGELEGPNWSEDGQRVAAVCSAGPDSWLAVREVNVFEINHERPEKISKHERQVAPGVHYAPCFTPNGLFVVFLFDNYAQPTDLWRLDLASGALRQLTHSLPEQFSSDDFIKPKHVWYPAPDGAVVPALLFNPNHSHQLPPAVIVIHGGPSWLFQYLWYPVFQHMASRGWVVLAPNYRGSTGYGRAWQLANRFDLGGVDTRDVVAGADYLARAGLADPRKIAVSGRSHGGYLTMTCLTQYPERFAGGSAIVPFLNWFSSHERIREDLRHWDVENMGDPVENYQRWYDASPYFFLERIQSPVQLICGAHDPRCPASDSAAARDRLLALGKTVDFILYPDEGHAFLKIANVVDHELRRVAFLAALFESEDG
jgi:dipeptidyl aminopeptidase/acylaminoacyl peptidase